MKRFLTVGIMAVWLLLPGVSHAAGNLSRTFAGGTATDNLASSANYQPANTYSVCWWGDVAAYDANSRRVYEWRNTDGTLSNQSMIYINNGGNKVEFSVTFSTTSSGWNIVGPATGSAHSICVTYDQSSTANTPIFYLNGSSVTVTTATAPVGTAPTNNTKIRIGNHASTASLGGNTVMNGSLRGFALWIGVILSSGEVSRYHAGESPCTIQWANLEAYVPMTDGASPEVDRSKNGANTWTVTGATTTAMASQMRVPQCTGKSMMGVGQ